MNIKFIKDYPRTIIMIAALLLLFSIFFWSKSDAYGWNNSNVHKAGDYFLLFGGIIAVLLVFYALQFKAVQDWFKVPNVQLTLIVLGLLIAINVGVDLANWDGTRRADEWLKPLGVDVSKEIPQCDYTTNIEIQSETRKRLFEQLREIKCREAHHIGVMKYFYVRYYMAITMSSVLGVLSAIILFFISKNGWAIADNRLIAIFIVLTAVAAYFYAFPSVFRQVENITDNKNLYVRYKSLENEVNSYFSTNQNIDGKITDDIKFIQYVDLQMSNLGNLAVGFDYTKIPQDLLKTVPSPNP